jgi:hypothetical protein
MRSDRSAEISGQQNCTEHRRPRYRVEDRTGKQNDPDRDDRALRVPELERTFNDSLRFKKFSDGVGQQKEYRQAANGISSPRLLRRYR